MTLFNTPQKFVGSWLLLMITLCLVMVTACQRESNDETAVALQPTVSTLPPVVIEAVPGTATGYPPPATPTSGQTEPYPDPPTRTPTTGSVSATPTPAKLELTRKSFIPSIINPAAPTPTETPRPKPTPTPTIDFAAVRAQLQAQGQDLAFAKIGFHTGIGGNRTGIGDWMRILDAAGVPFFIKTADDAGPLVEAQEIMRNSDVPHTLVYRRTGDEYDTPDYNLPPAEAARSHWQLHKEAFPPELDPNLIWIETINEVDKERSQWLGEFALETANLAMNDGYRWAAFGWSSGEPELSDWQSPSMLAFLRLAGENPDRLAIALHEYSFLIQDIDHEYPFKLGRFQQLFQLTDQQGIPRPTVLISEWGWEYQNVPSGSEAIRDINWAAEMYAPYPEIKGAAIWYLGGGFGDIADQAQRLIRPVTEYTIGTYFAIPMPPDQAPINPEQFRP